MSAFGLFIIMVLGLSARLLSLRKSGLKRHWTNQTTGEKILISIIAASVFQFLYFLPGWAIAASIVGYRDLFQTIWREFLFGFVALTANALLYSPVFYLLLTCISRFFRTRSRLN